MRFRTFVAAACVTTVSMFATDLAAQARSYVNPRSATDSTALPFSGGVLIGDTFYLSGNIGLENGRPPETPEAEASLVLNNIQGTLEEAGMTMDDLVVVQVFCSDVSYYAAFNGVYRTYFTGEFPARAFIGSGQLLFGARFEVQGIAVKR